jgi:hypothetical protein
MDGPAPCPHTITLGREGEPSGRSYCACCGALVLQVHTRPCGECHHFRRLTDFPICRKLLMAVTASMHVTYWVDPDPARGRHGLCFEETA